MASKMGLKFTYQTVHFWLLAQRTEIVEITCVFLDCHRAYPRFGVHNSSFS